MNELFLLGKTFLLLTGFFATLFFIAYAWVAIEEKDIFFATRPRRVSKYLKKKGFQNIEDFISSVLNSNFPDWEREKEDLRYYPFSRDKNLFFSLNSIMEESNFLTLSLVYKNAVLAKVIYDTTDKTVKVNKVESGLGELDQQTFNLKGKKLFEHVTAFVQLHREAHKEATNRELQKVALETAHNDLMLKRQVAKKERILENLLRSGQLWKERVVEGFRLDMNIYRNVSYATFILEGTPFVIVMWDNDNFTYEYINEEDKKCDIFKKNITHIEAFCSEHLTSNSQNSKSTKQSVDMHQENASFPQLVKDIEWLLLDLKEEGEWLTPSEHHLVTNTYPNDFHDLIATYYQLKNPTDIEDNVYGTLKTMREGLLQLSEKAETNKKQMIEKQSRLIHIRD